MFRDLLGRLPWTYSPKEKRGPEDMIDFFQGLLLPNSRTIDPNVWKVRQRQQEACMDE